jgi:uncharacterized membrane protein
MRITIKKDGGSIMNRFKKAILGIWATLMVFTGNALASTPSITVPESVDVSALYEVVGVVLVGLFAMWGIRKVIKLSNRS